MKKIKLTGKYVTKEFSYVLVDDEDYKDLNKHSWYLQFQKTCKPKNAKVYLIKKPYPRIRSKVNNKVVDISRFIMKFPDGIVDHIDGNRLNNQKSNLRVVNSRVNSMNRSSSCTSLSKFLGVCQVKESGKWTGSVMVNKKTKTIGVFDSETTAAEVRDIAALKYYGDFAKLNFPEKIEEYKFKFHTIDLEKERIYTSNYKGVSWQKKLKKWKCSVTYNKISTYLGCFDNEVEAAKAFDLYVIENNLNKKLNFPEEVNHG